MVRSDIVTVTVAKIGTALTFNAEYKVLDTTPNIHCWGKLTRVDTGEGLADKRLELYVTSPTGYSLDTFVYTMFDGTFSVYFNEANMGYPLLPGDWTLQAEFLGDEAYAGCEKHPNLSEITIVGLLMVAVARWCGVL